MISPGTRLESTQSSESLASFPGCSWDRCYPPVTLVARAAKLAFANSPESAVVTKTLLGFEGMDGAADVALSVDHS